MKRFIDIELIAWKDAKFRKSLLLRGARQVGKTYAVKSFAKNFKSFAEINLETQPEARLIFERDLDAKRIMRDIALFLKIPIIPGETLLFIDEIQITPNAVTALRYFHEQIPDLHVVAAGSLLDFAIEQVGIPVGRVESLYMYPMSFIEFLLNLNYEIVVQEILSHKTEEQISEPVHNNLLSILAEYLAIGGMPGVVQCWIEDKDPIRCFALQNSLIDTYRQDFVKYAKKNQIKHVEVIFNSIPQQLGKKFKFSSIDGDYRKRELLPALDLLVTAGIAHKVMATSGQGIPLGANVDPKDYKIIFLDVALCQSLLGLDLEDWFLNPMQQFVNKGAIVESFVGQELLAYSSPHAKSQLYYWQRNMPSSTAEIDYLIQNGENIIPIEVKSGLGTTLKSLHLFLASHANSLYGIKFSTQNYSKYEKIYSYPLYAVAAITKIRNKLLI
ncbi:ATP-binding protein [Candidatus Babeliales bacterium]|nr:ATP-binding protein [Candidatus Babeliales bacterium]